MVRIFIRSMRALAAAFVLTAVALSASAQTNKGTITPVDSDDDAPQKPVLHYYDKHGERLPEPVLYLAELDTVKGVRPSSPYPLYNGMVVGVNFADALLALTGQKHSSYDVSAAVSLHNWFFPIVEAGIGWGEHIATNDDYHYKAKPSFYAKVGINYNFLYKSKPDYMAYFGLRFGMSRHSWDITDIRPESELGKETGATELLGRSCMSIYGELVAGLKVKIAGPFALGWSIRYRVGKHNSGDADPWFVPGFGTNALGINFSAFFSFGEKKRRDIIPEADDLPQPEAPDMAPGLDINPDREATTPTSGADAPASDEPKEEGSGADETPTS